MCFHKCRICSPTPSFKNTRMDGIKKGRLFLWNLKDLQWSNSKTVRLVGCALRIVVITYARLVNDGENMSRCDDAGRRRINKEKICRIFPHLTHKWWQALALLTAQYITGPSRNISEFIVKLALFYIRLCSQHSTHVPLLTNYLRQPFKCIQNVTRFGPYALLCSWIFKIVICYCSKAYHIFNF